MKQKVFFEIVIGKKHIGRVVFELFNDLTPKTSENFRRLCIGDNKLHYLNSKITKIIKNEYIQGGELGESIYGKYFNDESFQRRHTCAGLLSMANKGKNTNSSSFIITLQQCVHLDGKNVVFGQAIQGMEIIREISKLPCDTQDRPKVTVTIINCGDLDIRGISNRENVFLDALKKMEDKRKNLEQLKNMGPDEVKQFKLSKQYNNINKDEQLINDEDNDMSSSILEDDEESDNKYNEQDLFNSHYFKEIKLKINEARNKNFELIVNPAKDTNLKSNKYEREKLLNIKRGVPDDKLYSLDSIIVNEHKHDKNINKLLGKSKGFDSFTNNSLQKAYINRLKEMPFDNDEYNRQVTLKEELENEDKINNYNYKPNEQRKELLVKDIEKQKEQRKKFSRRRPYYEDKDVLFINDRNYKYNQKLERFFGKEAAETKANIERGTAI